MGLRREKPQHAEREMSEIVMSAPALAARTSNLRPDELRF
jgi:hypothetical protein